MAKKFIQQGIKRPGRIKTMAKREGISTHAAAVKASHSSNKSLAAAGRLAVRFQKGGDLHGGNTALAAGSLKREALGGRAENIKAKGEFKRGYAP